MNYDVVSFEYFEDHRRKSFPDSSLATRRYLAGQDPSSLISSQHTNKYWTSSLKYLDSYVSLLKAIAGDTQTDVATINSIVSVGSSAASAIPGIPGTAGAALKALGNVANDAANLIAEVELVRAAQMATKPLAAAVKYLQKYYLAFEGSELIAFNFWDECAHEKLLFIRDNPFGRGPAYPRAYFGASDGVELDGAYAAWQTQRQTFQKAGTIANASATLNKS